MSEPTPQQIAALTAEVDQARQDYSNMLDDVITVCRENHRPGDPFAMPSTSTSILGALRDLFPNDTETQLWYAANLAGEAVVRLAENNTPEVTT